MAMGILDFVNLMADFEVKFESRPVS